MDKVYISLINHKAGMVQSLETVIGFNAFIQQEVASRGYPLVLSPDEADIILFLPTWEHRKECMEEYNTFKDTKIICQDIKQVVGAIEYAGNTGL